MSARAWQWRRKPQLLEVVPTVAEFGEPLQYRVIPRAELARTRRLEQLARRRARRQGRRFDTWAHRGWETMGATEAPWSFPDADVMGDFRASLEEMTRTLDLSAAQVRALSQKFYPLSRPIVETPPL